MLHAYADQYVSKFTSQAWAQAFVSQLADSQPASALSAPAVPLPLSALVAAPRSEPPLHTSSREQVSAKEGRETKDSKRDRLGEEARRLSILLQEPRE